MKYCRALVLVKLYMVIERQEIVRLLASEPLGAAAVAIAFMGVNRWIDPLKE
jgi:hypothetical protein